MELIWSSIGAHTEFLWSSYGVASGQRRDNLGRRSGEGRDNPINYWSKNGRNLAFAASIAWFTTKNTRNQK
jgi:hypothetical protein